MRNLLKREKPIDPRPFIRDAGRKPEGPVDAVTVATGIVAPVLLAGFITGFAACCIMNPSISPTAPAWNGAIEAPIAPWFPLVACTLDGLVIGAAPPIPTVLPCPETEVSDGR